MIVEKDFEAIALANGLRTSALQDALTQYPDDGTPVSEWIPAQRASKPHWFQQEADDKAPELYSLKAQGDHVRVHGEAATAALLAANGMKLGQVRPPVKADATTVKGAANPYSPEWRGTEAERQKKIASLITSMSTAAVASIAKAAGKKIDGSPLNKR